MPRKFPTAFTILFVLIIVVAALTWIIPAGEYERALNPALGKDAPVPGTFHLVEPNPQGLRAILMAPIAGLYNPDTGMANAIDVAVFVLVIGGFLAVVTKTGAIDAGIGWLLNALRGREIWMIPILMAAFAAGGTSYGMAEESLAFYAIVLPVFIRAGYDALTGVAVIMLGAGIGTLGSTFNAFATVIASNAAGVPFTDGLVLRVFILVVCLSGGHRLRDALCDACEGRPGIFRRRGPAREQHRALPERHRRGRGTAGVHPGPWHHPGAVRHHLRHHALRRHRAGLVDGADVGAVPRHVDPHLVRRQVRGRDGLDEETFVNTFVNGARDLLGVALIIGVARGIVVVMDAGKITDTILNALAGWLAGLGDVLFINTMLAFQTLLSFLVPSSSGLAVLTMPILAPLSDFAGVSRN